MNTQAGIFSLFFVKELFIQGKIFDFTITRDKIDTMNLKWLFTFLLLVTTGLQAQNNAWYQSASWITPAEEKDTLMRPCPVFRKQFFTDKKIKEAALYITALGLYEAALNGARTGNACFTPGWTNYEKRIQYQVYNVRELLKEGQNELLVTVGEGWFRGAFGGLMNRDNYGRKPALLCHLMVTYADGTTLNIGTDTSWRCTTGPVLHSDIYGGEIFDARINYAPWEKVSTMDGVPGRLDPIIAEPVTRHRPLKPVRIFNTPKGEQVLDFSQNLAGWIRLRIKGKAGDTIKLSHAEVLDKNGNFYTGNLREAKALDIYILKGHGEEVLEPHFTYHGFRYVKVEGYNALDGEFLAIPLYSDMPPAGTFTCSDTLINRLQENILWSLRSNFFDIPTDCPQRSERLGWTGDAQVFSRTAAFNYHVLNFFSKWLTDLKTDQWPDGSVPNIIPNIYESRGERPGVAGWGDAAVIIPWTLYWVYGDSSILSRQYSSMKAWVDYVSIVAKGDLWTAGGYGDWYAPGDSTSLPYIDQCFWAWSTRLLAKTASILGREEDKAMYEARFERIKTAFLKAYISPAGVPVTPTQTAYVLALQFELLPDSLKRNAADSLVKLIRRNNNHLATGFLGTPFLLHVLSQQGHTDVAYDLLMQDTWPSWLYPVKTGATTIWEKWDAIKPDGTVTATSYNHYAYGAVGDWLYRTVAGIDLDSAGYRHIIIRPQPGGGLTWAKATYPCPYGRIVSSWQIIGNEFILEVEIPSGVGASIHLPGRNEAREVKSGKFTFKVKLPVT